MPRIRTIKPEFWSDEKLSVCDAITRFVFLGLIGMADDRGRLLDNIKIIDAFIFPNTSDTCRESVATLSRIGRVQRGKTSSGQNIIQIVNWERHQRVDKPQYKAALPQIVEDDGKNGQKTEVANQSRIGRESVATHSGPDLLPTTNDLLPTTNNIMCETSSHVDSKPKSSKPLACPYSDDFEVFWDRYPRRRRVAKRKAWEAWKKAIKRCASTVIISAVEEYAESDEGRGEYVKQPATWLNGDCWDDDTQAWTPERRSRVATDEQLARWNPIDGGLG